MKIYRNTLALRWKRILERYIFRSKLERLYLVAGGHIFFQTLSAAVQLELFTLLDNEPGLKRETIRTKLDVEDKPCRILLLGCTALGLLRRDGQGAYHNTAVAAMMLSGNSSKNVIPVVKWQHFINYRALYYFADALRSNRNVGLQEFEGSGDTLYERLTHHPRLETIFQEAMHAISAQANDLLVDSVDFSCFRKIVDVGGGDASNLIAIARRYPGIGGVVFDSPTVCKIARIRIAEAALTSRLGAVEGDSFADEWPTDCDCVLFCHFMTIWSEEKNRLLLEKAHDALREGGAAIIFNMMQSDDESGPLTAAMGSPYFLTLATGEGMLYTWHEYKRWMCDAGFGRAEAHALVRDHGVVIGIK